MPLIVITLFVIVLHRSPRDAVGRLFTRSVIAAILFMLILIPGAVKGLFVDVLCMGGKNVLHAVGQITSVVIRHSGLLKSHKR
jgi:hypothetical protein